LPLDGLGIFTPASIVTGIFLLRVCDDSSCSSSNGYIYMNCDALNQSDCLARIMNDPRCDFCVNVKISSVPEYYVHGGMNYVSYDCYAARDMCVGAELCWGKISYGDAYWSFSCKVSFIVC
jgi:hypothetical protein